MNLALVKSSDKLFLIGITNVMKKKPWALTVMREMHGLVKVDLSIFGLQKKEVSLAFPVLP